MRHNVNFAACILLTALFFFGAPSHTQAVPVDQTCTGNDVQGNCDPGLFCENTQPNADCTTVRGPGNAGKPLCTKLCKPRAAANAPCQGTGQGTCGVDLECKAIAGSNPPASTCQPKAVANDECTGNNNEQGSCATGFFCGREDPACTPAPGPAGVNQCRKICKPRGTVDTACEGTGQGTCNPEFVCDPVAKQCKPKPVENQGCTGEGSQGNCAPGNICVKEDATCVNPIGFQGREQANRCRTICKPLGQRDQPCTGTDNGTCAPPLLCLPVVQGCTEPTCEKKCLDSAAQVLSPPPVPPPPPPPCAVALVNGMCPSFFTGFGEIATNPGDFLQRAFAILLAVSGGIALLLIMKAGYQLMVSAGNPEKVKAGREQLTAAIVGLLFIVFSFVILEVINVDILGIPGFG